MTKYVVVRYGDINRGEVMNIGLLAWEESDLGARRNGRVAADTPVHIRMLKDWKRIRAAFPRPLDFEEEAIKRVTAITTFGIYEDTRRRMGPYAPFELSAELPSTETAETTLPGLVDFFLVEPT